jgi:hypothetical protein
VSLPLDNWQFWAATLIFLVAAAWLLRTILPLRGGRHRRIRARRVNLTVKGRGVR